MNLSITQNLNSMNTTQKILVGLVVLLIICNVTLIGFIWKNRPDRLDERKLMPLRTERFFKNQLNLDDEQAKAFRNRIINHRLRMDELQQEIRQMNRELHESILLNQKEEEELISSQLDSLAFLIKHETTEHIRTLGEICSPDQRKQLIQALNSLPDRKGNISKRQRKRRKGNNSDQ